MLKARQDLSSWMRKVSLFNPFRRRRPRIRNSKPATALSVAQPGIRRKYPNGDVMNLQQFKLALIAILLCSATTAAQGTRLLRQPAVSRDLVAFEYAGDLWVVARNGGQARRLTATQGVETEPHFSPDGSQ